MLKLNLIHSFAVVTVKLVLNKLHVAFLNARVVKSSSLCGILRDIIICRVGVARIGVA